MLYLKAFHIIFIVTWFAGMFYMPRLFIYNTEAQEKSPEVRAVLTAQFGIMMKRLWFGITWPSAIITLILGPWLMMDSGWFNALGTPSGKWLEIKLVFVLGLYAYHFSLHKIYRQQAKGTFRYSSQKLRVWNEVATIFLIAIVLLATVKQSISPVYGLLGLVALMAVLMLAINVYKKLRKR